MDSSDDDIPIGARPVLRAAANMLEDDSDASGSPMPEWLSQHTPTQKGAASPASDDSDEVVDLSSPVGKAGDTTQKHAVVGNGNGLAVKKEAPKTAASRKASGEKKPGGKKSAADLPPAGLSQATAHIAAVPETAAIGGSISLTVPEKLAKGRFLVELEASEGGATDLAGDAGAVGRFSLAGGAGREGDMLLDLKGCIYNASMMPCATTLCIVNLQPSEAKVEAIMEGFISLREEVVQGGAAADAPDNFFMYDDDDGNYQIDEDGEKTKKAGGKRKAGQEDAEGGAGPAKKRKPAPKTNRSKGTTAKKKPTAKVGAKGGGKKK